MPDTNVVNKSTNMILNINNTNNYLKPQAIEHKKKSMSWLRTGTKMWQHIYNTHTWIYCCSKM